MPSRGEGAEAVRFCLLCPPAFFLCTGCLDLGWLFFFFLFSIGLVPCGRLSRAWFRFKIMVRVRLTTCMPSGLLINEGEKNAIRDVYNWRYVAFSTYFSVANRDINDFRGNSSLIFNDTVRGKYHDSQKIPRFFSRDSCLFCCCW